MANFNELVAAVRRHATANYNTGGWDILCECWGDDDIRKEIVGAKTEIGAIRKCARALRTMNDYRNDIINA